MGNKTMNKKLWLLYAIATTVLWGLWGALTGIFASSDIAPTTVYTIWAITMILPCVIVLHQANWQLQRDRRSIFLGATIGFLGSGGQMLLFEAVKIGPAYLIFPLVSLSPVITIFLSFFFLKERTGWLGIIGIALALIALPLFEYSSGNSPATEGTLWFFFAIAVMAAWGIQAWCMKLANATMSADSIFFYMTITALLLIPIAIKMTDSAAQPELDTNLIATTAGIQLLNAVGALCLVYAFRYGKAIIVSPLTNAGAPLISAVLVMIWLGVLPPGTKIAGIVLALIAAVLLAIEPDDESNATQQDT